MNILLDTHILIWAIYSPDKLTEKQKLILKDNNNTLYVSAISLWEISIKYSVKKLNIEDFKIGETLDIIIATGFNFLDLNSLDAISFHSLPKLENKDPFDRMLIWQSIQNNYHFMSADNNISEYKNTD